MLLGNRELVPDEIKAFVEALIKAFTLETFDTMLLKGFGWSYKDKTGSNGFENVVPQIIVRVQHDNKTHELLMAALAERPQNKYLLAFAQTFGIMFPIAPSLEVLPAQPLADPLEREILGLKSDLNPVEFRALLERLEKQICKVSIKVGRKEICGTGFLLSADIIMTNYHVMRDVIDGMVLSSSVTLYFDYKLDADGKRVNKGTPYKLAKDWLIDYSPNSDLDLEITEHFSDVEEKYLDYALLRLAKKVGNELLKGNIERGWIDLPKTDYEFEQGSSLFILHHPEGDPLKLAMSTQSVLEKNGNQTRIRYSTYTEEGSSGAPCFNTNWELVAIHQSGDPNFNRSAQYNQGIPIAAILRRLEKFGKKRLLGGKRNGKERRQSISRPASPCFQFAPPEGMMADDAQALLATLLQKTEPTKLPSSQPDKRKLQLPVELTENQLEYIVNRLNNVQVYSFFKDYIRIKQLASNDLKGLFDVNTDIRPFHFKTAINRLDMIEDCLQKICVLLNNSSYLPKQISLETASQFTVEAAIVIEKISNFRQYLVEEKDKYPYNRKIYSNIREKSANVLNDLDVFQKKFAEKAN